MSIFREREKRREHEYNSGFSFPVFLLDGTQSYQNKHKRTMDLRREEKVEGGWHLSGHRCEHDSGVPFRAFPLYFNINPSGTVDRSFPSMD